MSVDRVALFTEILESLEVEVWRSTRYARDTGTCLWCTSGPMVMIPDDASQPWVCQSKGADALGPRLEEALAARQMAARDAAPSDARQALVEAGERLWQAGFDEALGKARELFATLLRSRFESVPAIVEQRIASADFDQLQTWSGRLWTVPSAMLVVA